MQKLSQQYEKKQKRCAFGSEAFNEKYAVPLLWRKIFRSILATLESDLELLLISQCDEAS